MLGQTEVVYKQTFNLEMLVVVLLPNIFEMLVLPANDQS